MKTKLSIAVLLGLLVGAFAGAAGGTYFMGTGMMAPVLIGCWNQNAVNRLADTTLQLRLLNDGKLDSLQKILLSSLASSTIQLAGASNEHGDVLLKKQVALAGAIKLVQDDPSDIGQMAADARKRILTADCR